MRKKIFEIIEPHSERKFSREYDIFMIIVISLSLVPLLFKTPNRVLNIIEGVTVIIFIIDYLLRWITADYKYGETGIKPFLKYPFSFMAIIDLLSILPSITLLNRGYKILRVLRLLKALKAFRVVRYSKNIDLVIRVLKREKDALLVVLGIAIAYIFISALIIFQAEPNTFNNFYEAIYWATVSLTTIGYGDIVATTIIGKAVTMVSSLIGIAVVALPAGIITAGYLEELRSK